jgi:hypothetical protein
MREHEKLEDARADLKDREQKYLRKRGWTNTSSTPHYRWMWAKEWNGKQLLVFHDDAIHIQQFLDSRG